MAKDILIVDDIKSALANYGNDIRLNLGIEPFLADNAVDALNVLTYYPIKVLVTDQEMPTMLGTELVKKVKSELGLEIPCIMLTGHTNSVSVVEAVNLGFFKFIDKQNAHTELTPAIRSAIQLYDFEQQKKSTVIVNTIIQKKRQLVSFNTKSHISLVRISSVINTFVYESDWKTEFVAERNISKQNEVTIKKRVSTIRESSIDKELSSSLKLKSTGLLGELETALNGTIKVHAKIQTQNEIEYIVKHVINVNEITDSTSADGLVLASREYQSAPVYNRINCIVQTDCNCCNIKKQFDLSIDILTNRIALRHIEHFNRGQGNIIYTGFLDVSFDS